MDLPAELALELDVRRAAGDGGDDRRAERARPGGEGAFGRSKGTAIFVDALALGAWT